MANSSWICPYCGRIQTLTQPKVKPAVALVDVGSKKYPNLAVSVYATGCSNPDCDEVEVIAKIGQYKIYPNIGPQFGDAFSDFSLRPQSLAKPQPEYIPKPIRQDYEEACKIAKLSPKASATLSRRCLQGMIRNFCNVSGKNLFEEIDKLKKMDEQAQLPRGVTPESIEAAHAIRSVGNIGAHMEKDINVIIDVEPDEAETLIKLIETLFEDWYIARESRKQRFAKVKAIAAEKATSKISLKPKPKVIEDKSNITGSKDKPEKPLPSPSLGGESKKAV